MIAFSNVLRTLWVAVLLVVGVGNAAALTCTSTQNGDWKDNIWTPAASCNVNGGPPAGSTVIIADTVKVDKNTAIAGDITIAPGGTLKGNNGDTLSFSGNLTNNGTFIANGGTVKLTGTNQTITGNINFANLTVNAGTQLTLAGNITVSGTLTGTLNVVPNTSCPPNAVYTITDAAGAVVGNSCTGAGPYNGGGGGGGGGGAACGVLPSTLTSGTTLGFSQTGFRLNTNGGGATNVVNTTVTPNTTVAATGTLNALGVNASPTQAVTTTLPPLSPATFPAISGVNGALTNPAASVAPGSYTTITASNNNATIVFSGGATPTYIQKLISTRTTTTLQFAPGDYYIDSLTVSGNLTVSPAGLVRLFIGTQQSGTYGAAATTGGTNNNGFQANSQINTGGDPANLQLLLYPKVTYFEFDAGTQFTGIMYQPVVDAAAPRPNWGLAPGQFDLHTGVTITGSLYTPGVIETWGGNTFNYTPQVAAAISSFGTCAPGAVDHYLISHPGSGLTCSPAAVQVAACANAACTSYVGGMTVNVQPGGAAVATSAAGPVASTVSQTTAGTVSLSLTGTTAPVQCQNTATGAAASVAACTNAMTFSTSGYVVTVPNHLAGNTVSATVEAKQAGTNNLCVPAYANVEHAVNLAIAYVNPTTGTKSASITTNAATPVTGTVGTAATAYTLAFDANGKATIPFSYPDAGQATLNATGTAPNGAAMASSGGSYIAAPAAFSITAVTASPIRAGAAFSATISALDAAGNVTPNFGRETSPEGVTLSSVLAMGAGTWHNPALGNRVIAGGSFSNGVATVSNLSWSEVGDIKLNAVLTSGDYLGSAQTAATGITATATTFIPDHFDTWIKQSGVSPAIVPMACPAGLVCPANVNGASGMVYSGQPFAVQVIARNTTGCTLPPVGAFDPATDPCVTRNYQGATYAQTATLTEAASGNVLANNTLSNANFTLGVGTTAATALPSYNIGASAPADIAIRATATVSGATVSSSSFAESGLKVAQGRIKISNAYGGEHLPLSLIGTVEYCSAVSGGNCIWTMNVSDNSSSFDTATNIVPAIVKGPLTAADIVIAGGVTTVSGGTVVLNIAAPNKTGTVNIGLNAPAYLPTVSGQATFGVFKGGNQFIYQRESY